MGEANAELGGLQAFFTVSIIAKRKVFGTTLWQVEKLDIRSADLLAFYREMYRSAVASEALAKSVFDIYLDEGHLIYIKTPCGPTDTDESFFLHVHPKDKADLPAHRKPFNFDNLDFRFEGLYGIKFDDKCLARIPLPDYAIDHIQTGQCRDYPPYVQIWQATFRIPDKTLEK